MADPIYAPKPESSEYTCWPPGKEHSLLLYEFGPVRAGYRTVFYSRRSFANRYSLADLAVVIRLLHVMARSAHHTRVEKILGKKWLSLAVDLHNHGSVA